jgi:hypothetical protein
VRPPAFPIIGVVAPFVTSTVVWLVTGSSFAILGAVVAPAMVVAHFLDARRRSRRDERIASADRLRDEAASAESAAAQRAREIAELNRMHPSLTDIARYPEWTPARDGQTALRAGRNVDGSPWIVDVMSGVTITGDGVAADSIWQTLLFNARARLGEPVVDGNPFRWANGVILSRSESDDVGITIRCDGSRVLSIAARGELPVRGEWCADDVSRLPDALTRVRDRHMDDLSIELSDESPHVLVAGRTGSGKSRVLTALVTDWVTRFDANAFQFVGIDFKGGATLHPLTRFPHHRATVTDLERAIVPRMVAGLEHELRQREGELSRQGVAHIVDAVGMPRLAIVIDETHEFLRRHPMAHDVLADIARRGRSLGVHLVLAIQHPLGILRDGVLGNVPVRVCLAMNTVQDAVYVLGRHVAGNPSRGNALLSTGNGIVREVRIPEVSAVDVADRGCDTQPAPLWLPELRNPVPRNGRNGFGLLDDIANARYRIADWQPAQGDVWVMGNRGSGRTAALRALAGERPATWVSESAQLRDATGLVIVDDMDRILDGLDHRDAMEFLDQFVRCRGRDSVDGVVVSTGRALPRTVGTFPNVLALRTSTMEEHRATGAPPETFDPASAPGVGTWRGLRVVLYARTDSSDTASIP